MRGTRAAGSLPDPDPRAIEAAAAVRLARGHYENFPILSPFVSPRMRLALARIYSFARMTDDLGDEGSDTPAERLAALERWEQALVAALSDEAAPAVHPVLRGLAWTVREHGLPSGPFHALIAANRLDQLRARYGSYRELLEYCALSANPVGRIVIALFGRTDSALVPAADALCTALQLANHLQGIGDDLRLRDRLYLPLDELERFGVREADLLRERPSGAVRRLVGFQVDRTRELLERAAGLPGVFAGGPRAVVRLFLEGGRAALDAVEAHEADVLRARIRVGRRRAWLGLARAAGDLARARWEGSGGPSRVR